MPLSNALRTRLTDLVTANHVVLFMKGDRRNPQCGFSGQVVRILDDLGPDYETVDVLASPELRDGIKEFSEWPTIPQLYVAGKFVGGCDLVREMTAAGQLQTMLGQGAPAVKVPAVRATPAAVRELGLALANSGDDSLRLEIDAAYENDLLVGPREPGDVAVDLGGLTLLLSAKSVRRAEGLQIDFVDGPGGGFKLTNPNEPARVVPLAPAALKQRLDAGERIEVFDVRTTAELVLAKLAVARHLDDAGASHLMSLDRATPIAFLCHHGVRSRAAAERAIAEGFRHVYNIEGGIDAWSLVVDPSVRRY